MVVVAFAAPAASASGGNVPVGQLSVSTYGVYDAKADGTPGPVVWNGGHIGWYNPPAGSPTLAQVSYTVMLTGPGGINVSLIPAGVANIAAGKQYAFDPVTWGTKPMAGGVYTVTLTAFGSDASVSAPASVTLASPPPPPVAPPVPVTVAHTVTALGNFRQKIDVTFSGAAGTVINIGVNAWGVDAWNPAFPASATIGTGGTVTVSGTATGNGQWSGGVNLAFSSSVTVSPEGIYRIPIPA